MSANNVVWVMGYKGLWHVFYSGCFDDDPKEPDYKDKYYKSFNTKGEAILYAHQVEEKIDEFSLQKGFVGVEYGVCIAHSIDPELEETFERIKPTLDALYILSKTVTNKDIQKFVGLVEDMVNKLGEKLTAIEHNHDIRLEKLEEGLKDANKRIDWRMEEIKELSTTGEKPREPLVMPEALKAIMKGDVRRYIKNTYVDGHNDGIKRGRILESEENGIRKNRKDGCYQFTYCNECLAYPMGLGCPNLTKGPVQLKKLEKIPIPNDLMEKIMSKKSEPMNKRYGWKPCDKCDSWGQCDHQGAYQKDGKWCYE